MKNIYIVRHGESRGNVREVDTSEGYIIDSKIELTFLGKVQSVDAGEILYRKIKSKNGVFWVSPFTRTRQTYENMHKIMILDDTFKQYAYIEDPRLVEQDFGDFDFQFYNKWEEISPHSFFINQARYKDEVGRFFARLENGENMLDVYNRMSLFVKTRLETSSYKENIIVTHGYASIALVMFLLNLPIEHFYKTEVPKNGSIRHIVYKNGKYVDKGYLTKEI